MSEPSIEAPPIPEFVGVVGASAGGLTALRQLLEPVPASWRGALCIVMHLSPNRPSHLARILGRKADVPVAPAEDGQRLEPGHVYVAPPDRHLVIQDGHVGLVIGPTENGHRPAVDTLFRSAAHALGPSVVGVILSGSLDDGAAGLREIKARGGRAAVQRPEEADYAGMPLAALETIHPDLLASAADIGTWLARLTAVPGGGWTPGAPPPPVTAAQPLLTCPDCHGPLHEVVDGAMVRFDCLIGHRWSAGSLASFQRSDVEGSLWAALRALEEQAVLNRRLADRAARDGRPRAMAAFAATADKAEEQAAILRIVVEAVVDTALPADERDGAGHDRSDRDRAVER